MKCARVCVMLVLLGVLVREIQNDEKDNWRKRVGFMF